MYLLSKCQTVKFNFPCGKVNHKVLGHATSGLNKHCVSLSVLKSVKKNMYHIWSISMLVQLAGAKFHTILTAQGVKKIIKITKVYIEKSFGNIFLKQAELKNVLSQVVNHV